MRNSVTAVSLLPQGVEIRNQFKGVQIIIGLDGVLKSVSKGKINEPKDGQDSHIRNFRVGCSTVRVAANARSRHQNPVSQHGPA